MNGSCLPKHGAPQMYCPADAIAHALHAEAITVIEGMPLPLYEVTDHSAAPGPFMREFWALSAAPWPMPIGARPGK